MGRITLVTGGCRSGKSSFAEKLLGGQALPATYIATCPLLDDEMKARVTRHKHDRRNRGWTTIEEEIDLAGAVTKAQGAVLIDCLSLWNNNLLYAAQLKGAVFNEEDVHPSVESLIDAMKRKSERCILVTNEVGMGIVPDNAVSRLYRDCAGRIAQMVAAAADDVILLVAGVPLAMKGECS